MFQQRYVPQKNVSITTARHSPRSSSPHPLRPTPLYGPCKMAPLPIPPGFIARNPANSFFCPQIFLPKPIPDVLPPRPCFSKNMRRKKSQHNHRTTFASIPRAPTLCAQHRSMDHAKWPPYQSHRVSLPATRRTHFFALKSFCQNRSLMSCYHGSVSAKTCAAKKCQHNHCTTFA